MRVNQHGALRRSEKVLGILALVILFGWILCWTPAGGEAGVRKIGSGPGLWWFGLLSAIGSLLVLALIFMKFYCVDILPERLQEKLLPCVSLLPVLGFFIMELDSIPSIFTVGGSIALAYISATSYWRSRLPEFVTNPLGEGAKPAAASGEPTPKPAEAAPAAGGEAKEGAP